MTPPDRRGPRRRAGATRRLAPLVVALFLPGGGVSGQARGSVSPWIVVLRPGVEPEGAARSLAVDEGFRPSHVYPLSLRGFAADLSPGQVARLGADPRVAALYPDVLVRVPTAPDAVLAAAAPAGGAGRQRLPTGITRCGADRSPTAAIDGIDSRLDVDVALLDTGIDPDPDLRVPGGRSFVGGGIADPNGHGTHVAGIIGARDNRRGVVGVAPGARLWSVRVLNRRGVGRLSDIIAGIEWVTRRADVIEVANLSLGGVAGEDAPLEAAVNACVKAGVTVVAAAGNDATDAAGVFPARYEAVITVSALADSNGAAGPSAGLFQVRLGYTEEDESFADFSNFGAAVDLIAPGVRILSTYRNRRFAYLTGTSQAAPHVAGAAALYLHVHPGAPPAEVRQALLEAAQPFSAADDPDPFDEPALDASAL